MTLVIDNYDSFTFNLVQYLRELGETVQVFRNDAISVDDIRRLAPGRIVVSPGPCTPKDAGISVAVIRELGPTIPVLGICLGHQAIGAAFGGEVVRAPRPMHGKVSAIRHDESGVFAGLPTPFDATRYHSLVVERRSLPECLEITAQCDDGDDGDDETIQGVRHREYPVHGVQFHPESILSEHGHGLLKNFLDGDHKRRSG